MRIPLWCQAKGKAEEPSVKSVSSEFPPGSLIASAKDSRSHGVYPSPIKQFAYFLSRVKFFGPYSRLLQSSERLPVALTLVSVTSSGQDRWA